MPNRYRQQADEHPRPHVDVPMRLFGEAFFRDSYELVGRFVHWWCHAIWKKDPYLLGGLTPDEIEKAVCTGFLIADPDGRLRLTGPNKDPRWLLNAKRIWWTYAIEAAGQATVKIGRCLDVERRQAQLQIASPFQLVLLGVRKGDFEDTLHRKFAAHRIDGGEWFRLDDEVDAELRRFLRGRRR